MKIIYIQDNKGYGKKRINSFLRSFDVEHDIFFLNDFEHLQSDAGHFFFIVYDLEDFLYYVKKYASFSDCRIIVSDCLLIKEFKKCDFEYFTFKKFYNFISE